MSTVNKTIQIEISPPRIATIPGDWNFWIMGDVFLEMKSMVRPLKYGDRCLWWGLGMNKGQVRAGYLYIYGTGAGEIYARRQGAAPQEPTEQYLLSSTYLPTYRVRNFIKTGRVR
jgi:hypothetical protein